MNNKISYILIFICFCYSCNVKKFIPENELLYTGANIEIESDTTIDQKKELITELESVIKPSPNSKFLGMRPGLYFHYKAQREKPGFINKFLNKNIGEEPVYLSDIEITNTEELLLNRLENRGFFYSRVESEVSENEEEQVASTDYKLIVPEPYLLETYQLDTDTLKVYRQIQNHMEESLLEKGMRFDLPRLKAERERLDMELKKEGYYNFNPGFLIFEADTNQYVNKKRFDLYLRLKKDVPSKSVIPYRISNVNVYANYNVDEDSITKNFERYEEKNYFQEEVIFKPKYLDPYILIESGDLWDPEKSRNTSRRLGSIGSYKFVNIRYDEIDTLATDSIGLLEANIYLSPLKKRAIRAELQAVTKSNNFTGPHLALTFSNRNLFKGGESYHASANLGFEFQSGSAGEAGRNSVQLGLTNDLIIPRMLFPINLNTNFFKYSIPKTKISLGADYLTRSELFSLTTLSFDFGYYWNANKYVSHEINPISLNYLNLGNVTEEFQAILDENSFLEASFRDEFIAGLNYSFTYNGIIDPNEKHVFFLNSNFEIAGNAISLFAKENDNGEKEVLGLKYSQYAKLDADFRYHLRMGNSQVIATRLYAGYGLPYGNSEVMPYSKQFFAGGPYSVRAFRTRSLGPGTYTPPGGDAGYRDLNGNIRLEANAEYRFPLITYLNGAVFVDAGNVWTSDINPDLQDDPGNEPGVGKFSSNFINELGIGTGVGLRVDIQSFVIRFDLAAPLHDPTEPGGPAWVFEFDKPVFNFAIGYPF
ncbi:hypothetical protein E0K83_08240 [Gramella sp. BOM4]|nr:hypothetical protein [Christiangramia bathymodioli]